MPRSKNWTLCGRKRNGLARDEGCASDVGTRSPPGRVVPDGNSRFVFGPQILVPLDALSMGGHGRVGWQESEDGGGYAVRRPNYREQEGLQA